MSRAYQKYAPKFRDGQVQPDTHVIPTGIYVIGLGYYVIATGLPLVIA